MGRQSYEMGRPNVPSADPRMVKIVEAAQSVSDKSNAGELVWAWRTGYGNAAGAFYAS